MGGDLDATIEAVEEGRADVHGAELPFEVRDPLVRRFGINRDRLFRISGVVDYFLALNTSRPLFRDYVALRKAVNAFDTRIAPPRIQPIGAFNHAPLVAAMRAGAIDAWMVHLAEGVRDGSRRPEDTFSSRAELDALVAKGLLTDMTVVVHGTALERTDFAALRAAPTIRDDGVGDGRGAKLVWSPLPNLLLYPRDDERLRRTRRGGPRPSAPTGRPAGRARCSRSSRSPTSRCETCACSERGGS
jgi:hypothetical protein